LGNRVANRTRQPRGHLSTGGDPAVEKHLCHSVLSNVRSRSSHPQRTIAKWRFPNDARDTFLRSAIIALAGTLSTTVKVVATQ